MNLNFDKLFPTLNTLTAQGIIRCKPSDFVVTELNTIELSGQGEHLWLYVKKTNSNTNWVAKQLSNICQVPQRQVGFAGLKDRHAVTSQFFSVQLPKVKDVDKIQAALPEDITVLKAGYHHKKIKTGQLDANQFEITIREVKGDKKAVEQNIQNCIDHGVPNYFGSQRFGHNMGNIEKCHEWFSGNYKVKSRNLKSLLISTARSHIFNLIVAERLRNCTWNTALTGDILQLNNSKSWFPVSQASKDEVVKRLSEQDLHLTAAMWGEDDVQSSDECALLENDIASQFPIYQRGFEKFRLKQDRRAMRICAQDLNYSWQQDKLLLKFKLAPGAYATGIMREILVIEDSSFPNQ